MFDYLVLLFLFSLLGLSLIFWLMENKSTDLYLKKIQSFEDAINELDLKIKQIILELDCEIKELKRRQLEINEEYKSTSSELNGKISKQNKL